MDFDKDGIMGKNDLRQTFDMIGRIATDAELDEYLSEAPGPISFTMLLNMFGERMSGGKYRDQKTSQIQILPSSNLLNIKQNPTFLREARGNKALV